MLGVGISSSSYRNLSIQDATWGGKGQQNSQSLDKVHFNIHSVQMKMLALCGRQKVDIGRAYINLIIEIALLLTTGLGTLYFSYLSGQCQDNQLF